MMTPPYPPVPGLAVIRFTSVALQAGTATLVTLNGPADGNTHMYAVQGFVLVGAVAETGGVLQLQSAFAGVGMAETIDPGSHGTANASFPFSGVLTIPAGPALDEVIIQQTTGVTAGSATISGILAQIA